jgi:hypothetical protein
MNDMKKNQNGFSVVEGVLILGVIALLGFMGWLIWQAKNKPTASHQTPTAQHNGSAQEPKDETEGWTSFTPNSKLFTVKLPDGWTFLHQADECDCLYAQTMTFKAGTPATIGKTQGGRDGIFGYFIAVDDGDKSSERFKGFKKQGTIKAGSLEGTKYYREATEAESLGLDKGGKEYSYYFIKNGKGIYLSYSMNPGDPNNLVLVEKSIKTLR